MNNELDDVLLTALRIFFRYGYRKTSLDDIAQEVGVSRQTLYQRYKNKEQLFINAVDVELATALNNCRQIADKNTDDVENQLLNMFDVLWGPYIDLLELSPHATEIISVSNELVGDCCEKMLKQVLALIERVLEKTYDPHPSISYAQIADTLVYLGEGAFHKSHCRKKFNNHIKNGISVICRNAVYKTEKS